MVLAYPLVIRLAGRPLTERDDAVQSTRASHAPTVPAWQSRWTQRRRREKVSSVVHSLGMTDGLAFLSLPPIGPLAIEVLPLLGEQLHHELVGIATGTDISINGKNNDVDPFDWIVKAVPNLFKFDKLFANVVDASSRAGILDTVMLGARRASRAELLLRPVHVTCQVFVKLKMDVADSVVFVEMLAGVIHGLHQLSVREGVDRDPESWRTALPA